MFPEPPSVTVDVVPVVSASAVPTTVMFDPAPAFTVFPEPPSVTVDVVPVVSASAVPTTVMFDDAPEFTVFPEPPSVTVDVVPAVSASAVPTTVMFDPILKALDSPATETIEEAPMFPALELPLIDAIAWPTPAFSWFAFPSRTNLLSRAVPPLIVLESPWATTVAAAEPTLTVLV